MLAVTEGSTPALAATPANGILSDPHHRYSVVGRKLEGCREVLDIGGYKDCGPWLRGVAPDVERYVSLNISAGWYGARDYDVWYDGAAIPFRDKSFDAVICVDSMEHMRDEDRLPLLQAALRVARRRVVLLFPFASEETIRFETEYRHLLVSHGLPIKPSLDEHFKFGLPDPERLVAALGAVDASIDYVTDLAMYREYVFAQVIVSALVPSRADEMNALLQAAAEARLSRPCVLARTQAMRALVSVRL